MTARITKEQALERLAVDMPVGACPMCTVIERGGERVLARGTHATAVLNGYPLELGHALVVLHDHVRSFSEVSPEAHAELVALAHDVARRVEAVLEPARVFVASLGSDREGLAMTTPHLHYHVIPIRARAARPSEVLTWERGVLDPTAEEWAELVSKLRL
jgi:diadenosine tetraphosphate (Ap4A) HIT family hydrolase